MRQGLLPPVAPIVADEIDEVLGFDACCSLRRIVTRVPFCAKPAEWAVKLACCGNVKVVCKVHRNLPLAIYPKLFICNRCHAKQPGVTKWWPV